PQHEGREGGVAEDQLQQEYRHVGDQQGLGDGRQSRREHPRLHGWGTAIITGTRSRPATTHPVSACVRPPDRGIQVAVGAGLATHAPADHRHALGAHALALRADTRRAFRKGDASVGPQHAVPRQRAVGVLRQHPRRQPCPARQAGATRHLAITGDLPARDRAHGGEDAGGGVNGIRHGRSLAPPCTASPGQKGKAALRRPPVRAAGGNQAQPIAFMPRRNSQARPPAAGMVMIQAQMMRSITPIFSARGFLAKPTPMIAVEMLWVVETGMPKCAARVSTVAELVSAAKPWIGCSLTILWPRVLMMRQPPEAVPAAITRAQVSTIQVAMWVLSLSPGCRKASHDGRLSRVPAASAPIRVRAMMPMVFCASLWPWAKPMYAAEAICALPKNA